MLHKIFHEKGYEGETESHRIYREAGNEATTKILMWTVPTAIILYATIMTKIHSIKENRTNDTSEQQQHRVTPKEETDNNPYCVCCEP